MSYPTGPGRHWSRGPVAEAYADKIDSPCPPPPFGCGAKPGDWCMHPTDRHNPEPVPRKVPCLARPSTKPEETP